MLPTHRARIEWDNGYHLPDMDKAAAAAAAAKAQAKAKDAVEVQDMVKSLPANVINELLRSKQIFSLCPTLLVN